MMKQKQELKIAKTKQKRRKRIKKLKQQNRAKIKLKTSKIKPGCDPAKAISCCLQLSVTKK